MAAWGRGDGEEARQFRASPGPAVDRKTHRCPREGKGSWHRTWRLGRAWTATGPMSQTRRANANAFRHSRASREMKRRGRHGVVVRVVEYHQVPVPRAKHLLYRLLTTVLHLPAAPAARLIALYHEPWEIETNGPGRTQDSTCVAPGYCCTSLLTQGFLDLLLAHQARTRVKRGGKSGSSSSTLHAVRLVWRQLARFTALPPSAPESLPCGGAPGNLGGTSDLPSLSAQPPWAEAQNEPLSSAATHALCDDTVAHREPHQNT